MLPRHDYPLHVTRSMGRPVGLVGTFLGVVVSIVFTRVMGYFLCKFGLEFIEFALGIFSRTLEDVFLSLLGRQIIGIL